MTALIVGLTAAVRASACVQKLDRAHLAPAHELREAERVVADVFLEGHAGSVSDPSGHARGAAILAAGIVDTGKPVQNDALQQ